MATLPQITDLFMKLTTRLHHQSSDNQMLHPAISCLTQSLNHNGTSEPASGVLDAALSLLCFKATDLFDASIECLSDTIVALLSSSMSCRALDFPEDSLQVGSLLSCSDCADLIGMCADFVATLDGSKAGMLRQKLLRAVLKLATSLSCYNGFAPSRLPCEDSGRRLRDSVRKLNSFFPADASTNICETPLRLLFWYLDPSILKHDISSILREKMERPFLCMEKELHERTEWRSLIICLVTSPSMFIEARALLHHWFLSTGLASLLELQTELVSSLLDALARPMRWGMSMDLGLKLPFLHAYFPGDYSKLLVKLSGPISCEGFLDLVHIAGGQTETQEDKDHPAYHYPHSYGKQAVSGATLMDHNSTWAMVMDFPAWFYFAVILLFSRVQFRDIFASAFNLEETYDSELSCAAAKYLSWILNPINDTEYDWLFHCLTETSGSWILKQREANAHQSLYCVNTFNPNTVGINKNFRKPKSNDSENNEDILQLELWLKGFDICCIKYHGGKSANLTSVCFDSLFRKIPLGILIGYSRHLDDEAYELLLHYAATGSIIQFGERNDLRKKHAQQRSKVCNDVEVAEEGDERQGAASGASLVFHLFDVIENMLDTIKESEDRQCDFVCNMKGKVGGYLLRCVKRLVVLETYESKERRVMLTDLCRRLERWSQRGGDIFEGSDAFNDVVCDLKSKICS